MADPWDDHARWWQREFTEGVDAEYTEQILPLILEHLGDLEAGVDTAPEPVVRLLDLGCGEGQVARITTELLGTRAVGVDASGAQVIEARRRGGGPSYVQGSAAAIGLADAAVDAAVACLVFEHLVDPDSVLDEVARVVRSGGRFLWLLNHPLIQTPDSGWIDDHMVDPPEQYWQLGPYLPEAETVEQVERDVFITFFHRPLSRYLNAAIERGFVLEQMLEPAPPPGFLARAPEYAEAATVPRLMFLRFRRS